MKTKIFFFLLGTLLAGPAMAQTCQVQQPTPQFTSGGTVFGRLSSQWNQYFAAKVAANNGAACNLTVTGTLNLSGATIVGSLIGQFRSTVVINTNVAPLPTPLTGTLLQGGATDAVIARSELDSWGAYGAHTCRVGNGTNALPTVITSGTELCEFNAWGYDGTTYVGPAAALRLFGAGTWSVTSRPTEMRFATVASGSTTLTDRWHVAPTGGLYADGVTGGDKGVGTVNTTGIFVNGGALGGVATATAPLQVTGNDMSLGTRSANAVLAGPTSGGAAAPAFRALVAADTPWPTATQTFLATTSSANLAAAMSTKTGTAGNLVFSLSPTITTPIIDGDLLSSTVNAGGNRDITIFNNSVSAGTQARFLARGGTTNNYILMQVVESGLAGAITTGAGTTGGLFITPGAGNVHMTGTATNNNQSAGYVGEYISSEIALGSAVSLSNATAANVTSISLTAGDWDVYGTTSFINSGSTTLTNIVGAIATTSATVPTFPNGGGGAQLFLLGGTTTLASNTLTFSKRLSLASTTTVYLVASAAFTNGTITGYGFIGARRMW
jgi:hypothetical protein